MLLVLPYALSLSPALARVFTPFVLFPQLIQTIIEFSIAIFIGLYLAKRVRFGLPVLEGWLEGNKVRNYLKSILGISIGFGILAGILIILLSFLFTSVSNVLLIAEISVSIWKGFLASFYGGIGEEILLRLFLMTLIFWIFFKIKKKHQIENHNYRYLAGYKLSAIIFGLGHLPITGTITTITPIIVARAIILNGIGEIIFGWFTGKKDWNPL